MWRSVLLPLVALLSQRPVRSQPLNGVLDGIRILLFDRPPRNVPPSAPEPMRVVGAGLPRTGTGSLHEALGILGYKTYHMIRVMENAEHTAKWAAVADGRSAPDDAFDLLARSGFNASVDFPTSDLFEVQMRLHPEAKVVLSVRDDDASWARSYRVLADLVELMERPFSPFFPTPLPLILRRKVAQLHAVRCAMGTAALGLDPCEFSFGIASKPEGWLEGLHRRHLDYVKSKVPPERLLVFNVKEGWEPLCAFLGKPVPAVPFPHFGESAFLRWAAVVFRIIVYGWIPVLALLCWMSFRCCFRPVEETKMKRR